MADSKLSSKKGKWVIPLTPSNAIRVVWDIKKWNSKKLGRWLFIPGSKLEEIKQNFPDSMEQRKQIIIYWINTDPLASWRRLICGLDVMEQTELADSIRCNAEPLTDASLTPHTILRAVSTVREFWGGDYVMVSGLLERLRVPHPVRYLFKSSPYPSEHERRIAGLRYYLQTVPGASWPHIAGTLWFMKEYKALGAVRQHLTQEYDPSLNLFNMTVALDALPDLLWEVFGRGLDVPQSTLNQIGYRFPDDGERKVEVYRIYLAEHPYPSWEHISDVVYRGGYFNQLYHSSVLVRLQTLFPTGRNRAKRVYEEEIKRGVSKRIITKLVMIGAAGSGKSTSLETVMDEEPPAEEDRESTPLLKRPVQTEVIFVDKNVKWRKKTPEEKKRYIASLLRARAQRLEKPTVTGNDPPSVPIPPTTTSAPLKRDQPKASAQQSAPATENTEMVTTTTPRTITPKLSSTTQKVTVESLLQSCDDVDHELISLINIPSDTLETLITERCVYIVDSGGQPEFVDAMTVFLGQTSACILVIDLSQPLDYHPMVGYYRRGKAVSKPYPSIRTNEDNLKQSMQTMRTFTSKSKGPLLKLLFLGTHRDKLHECLTETVEDKDKQLQKIIPAKFTKQVIWFSSEKLIFEMNALNPDDNDKKTAERIRRYIIEQCPTIEVDIPLRWHTFEEKLRSFATSLGRMVMSCHECWLIAGSLGLDKASFDGALDFFHNVSLMFYFRDILPGVVFIDPQVILDKVSELIEFMFELREPAEQQEPSNDTPPARKPMSGKQSTYTQSPETGKHLSQAHPEADKQSTELPSDAAVSRGEEPSPESHSTTSDVDILPPGWHQFKKFGQITEEFLNDQRFSSHYHTGIFTSDNLIHLLEELLVIAKQSTDDDPDTWFMPSVLGQAPAEKVCVSSGALVVDFPDSGPQNGVFCSLMSHVLSPNNHNPCPWKIHLSSQEPACLYRNCIQFEVPKFPGSVTLIDRYEYFEVDVFTSEGKRQELWQHVRNALFGGIETVCEMLGYSKNKLHPAIVCPKTHTDKAHPAYIEGKEWICSSDSCVFGYLKDIPFEVYWHQGTSTAMTSATALPLPSSHPADQEHCPCTLGIDDLFTITSELLPVAHRWKRIGLALRLDPSLLDRIRAKNHVDVDEYLSDVLAEWLKKAYNTSRFGDPSWNLLVDAVAHPAGGNNRALAEHIATKYNS